MPSRSVGRSSVSVAVARKSLDRLPLDDSQRAIFRALFSAHPAWTGIAELGKKAGCSRKKTVGLMEAFIERVTNTPGYVGQTSFFEFKPNSDGATYRLTDEAREALQIEHIAWG